MNQDQVPFDYKANDYVELFIQACRDSLSLGQDIFLNAHPLVTHAAYDADGEVYGYIGEPKKNVHSKCWIDKDAGDFAQPLGFIQVPGNWEESLIKRIKT